MEMNLKNILTTSENFYETEMVEYPYVFIKIICLCYIMEMHMANQFYCKLKN